MVSLCFYFQVHQPFRMRKYTVFDIARNHKYFNDKKNREVMLKVAKKCYLPMNNLILNQISETDGKFKAAFSLSGTFMEQAEQHCPEVIDSFKDLAKTGNVEFLGETYYHSLAFIHSRPEFREQVKMHSKKISQLFKQKPSVFRNTELIYNNEVADEASRMGFSTVLAEGADHILNGRSPNLVYSAGSSRENAPEFQAGTNKISMNKVSPNKVSLLLKNYRLSDDIAFRFSNQAWEGWPLSAEKFSSWVNDSAFGNVAVGENDASNYSAAHSVNLFMDYETFGEHQWAESGIFNFMKQLPAELLKNPNNNFMTPSEVSRVYPSKGALDIPNLVSWADMERDVSAWLGNKLQESAARELYLLERPIKRHCEVTGDLTMLNDWRMLQTSDHFYYMCTKYFSDGDVHKYFNPYETPYEAYMYFMNILNDLKIRLGEPKKLGKL